MYSVALLNCFVAEEEGEPQGPHFCEMCCGFDDNTAWGQLTILELKLLIFLALQQHEEAKECVEMLLQYNDNTADRGLFYQAMNAVLEMELDDDLELADYEANFRRMFGDERMDAAVVKAENFDFMREDKAVAQGWIGALHVEGLLSKEQYEVLDAELDKAADEWEQPV